MPLDKPYVLSINKKVTVYRFFWKKLVLFYHQNVKNYPTQISFTVQILLKLCQSIEVKNCKLFICNNLLPLKLLNTQYYYLLPSFA